MPTLTTLVSFNGTNGANPQGSLIADANGNLFGTTRFLGANNAGTVFEIAKTGTGYASTPTTLVSFSGTDGSQPSGSLIADANGDLFGTTQTGGANNLGSVFEIAKAAAGYASTPTTLVSFSSTDGANPTGSLIADANGDLFGTTANGGANNAGTVFEIAKTGTGYASTPTTLVSFTGTDGARPVGSLIADANGDLFGTTFQGGASGLGTVFEIAKTATGYASTPTTLVSFNSTDGANPQGSLIADANRDLFGTTEAGGANNAGTVFEIAKTGTGYASTPTTLVSFNSIDGAFPVGSLIADANGDLFGTTIQGGANNVGTVFEIAKTAAGYASTPTTLVSFSSTDGAAPTSSLIADANGDLFGTTIQGGANNVGTVFEITGSGFVVAPPPTGVSLSPATASLAGAQSRSGLAPNAKLATVAQVGGQSGDSFNYTLGGTGASAFSLTSTSNVGTLSTGPSGAAGGQNGKLYALTLTANDTTTGTSSPASPFDVVVGSSGKDTVSLATLVGSLATATPTFVYGLAGKDTINGTGMTGELWFVGGKGADTMTGGSGPNDYVYGATHDSTARATDIITNFDVTKDLIDLTGIGGSPLAYVGQFTGTKLAPHSVGWKPIGGNTFVYVNTSGSAENIHGTDMKIELLGSPSLTSSNILHQ